MSIIEAPSKLVEAFETLENAVRAIGIQWDPEEVTVPIGTEAINALQAHICKVAPEECFDGNDWAAPLPSDLEKYFIAHEIGYEVINLLVDLDRAGEARVAKIRELRKKMAEA